MLETEVKFMLADPIALRSSLAHAQACPVSKTFEINFRYDSADNHLLNSRCLLRLRKDDSNRLTFKRPRSDGGKQFKVHEELEIKVSDFDTTDQLLKALGYQRVQVYEKHRETFEMSGTEICMDHLPYGHFLEIEGTPEAIPLVAKRLGLQWSKRILANYLQIFETIRQALNLPFGDVTFANFKNVQTDLTPLIRAFETDALP